MVFNPASSIPSITLPFVIKQELLGTGKEVDNKGNPVKQEKKEPEYTINPTWYRWFQNFVAVVIYNVAGAGYLSINSGVLVPRTFGVGSTKLSVTNGSGVSGNTIYDVVEANLTLSNIGGSVTTSQLPTVNSSPGTFGSAAQVPQVTVTNKGLSTIVTNVNIQITESQVTNLTTDLAGKQALNSFLTVLSGYANSPKIDAYCSTNQSIPNATATKVALNTVVIDTNSNFSTVNNRFTPTVAGYYLIIGHINLATVAGSYTNQLMLYKNGSSYAGGLWSLTYLTAQTTMEVSRIIQMNGSTDFIELFIQQNSGSSQTIAGGSTTAYMSGSLIV